jgi:hypothetical protein
MKYKHIPLFFFLISLFFTVLLFFRGSSMYPSLDSIFKSFGLCEAYLGHISCYHWSWVTVDAFVFLFANLFFVSIFLFFISKESLIKWCNFSKLSIPILFALVVISIVVFRPSFGFMEILPSFNSILIFIFPLIFTIKSLVLFFKNRAKAQKVLVQ